jgi:prolipoprotein diacylglyceryltransferase/protein-S-isoprenylcysteine O-methyltransferase Ste14
MLKEHFGGKLLYAVLFLFIIPSFEWWWAQSLHDIVQLPSVRSYSLGLLLLVAGIVLLIWGMIALMHYGKGLPMNAYPPKHFVQQGPYYLFHHPIYIGYCIALFGLFVLTGSKGGFWVVLPLTILSIMALVIGYESIDLHQRFGIAIRTLFDLPDATNTKASIKQRIISFVWVIVFLLISNLLFDAFLIDFVRTNESFVFGFVPFLMLLLTVVVLPTAKSLRLWSIACSITIVLYSYFLLLYAPGTQVKYTFSSAIYPFFKVPFFLVYISCFHLMRYTKIIAWPVLITGLAFHILFYRNQQYSSAALIYSTVLIVTGMYYQQIWGKIRSFSEQIANSWQEWRVGPLRIINHGFYIGIAGAAAIISCGLLTDASYSWALFIFSVVVIVCSALWAQLIEGSEKLKRPFGFYGAMIGIVFASVILWLMGFHVWVLIGTISVVMPWVQAIGRLRCLVNGCCHGKPTHNHQLGIRFYHERSRVTVISALKGAYLHPTQVYSMLWLFFIGFLLISLWIHNCNYAFIFGIYLILTGIGRFVEEAYRGEVQTPVQNGLRLYQWAALVSVIAGIIFTVIPTEPVVLLHRINANIFIAGFLGGLLAFFAMGVDFPESNARFSRLV